MESALDFVGNDPIKQIVSVYAGRGYDAKSIRGYLKSRNVIPCIPFRKNNKTEHNDDVSQNNYNKIRFVVERFFAWLKNGFHKTRIRYEQIAGDYLGFVTIACIMMYWRVLG